MKAPQYAPSRLTANLQRRIFITLIVALFAMVAAFVSYPFARKLYFLSRLDDPRPVARLRAMNVLTKLAVDHPDLRDALEEQFVSELARSEDSSAGILAQLGSWAVKSVPTFKERFHSRLDTRDDAVFKGLIAALRESGEWKEADLSPERRGRLAAIRCAVENLALRTNAIEELARLGPVGEKYLIGTLLKNLHHESPRVRLAAVKAISVCLPNSRGPLLQKALSDVADEVRIEAQARLAILRWTGTPTPATPVSSLAAIIEKMHSSNYFAQLEAIDQAARIEQLSANDGGRLSNELAKVVEAGLSTGNGGLAGKALEALADLQQKSYLPVMLDVAAGFDDQPMLRFMAARAASRLEEEAGGGALINLFSQDSDVVRDLSAIALSRLDHPQILKALKLEMFSPDLEVRGPAAMSLALRNEPQMEVRNMTLVDLLLARTTLRTENVHAEPQWKPRGYYLCARLILGDDSVRDELRVFELNEHFPRIALYTALLHSGEASPLDLILLDRSMSALQRRVMLRDMRFAEVIAHTMPMAPRIYWWRKPEMVNEQVATLARWWSIYRWNIEFDRRVRRYFINSTGS